jgi:hypothetical protein
MPCPFACHGCETPAPVRRDWAAHQEDCAGYHADLFSKKESKYKAEIQTLCVSNRVSMSNRRSQLFVRMVATHSKTITVNVDELSTVKDVKEQIETKEGLPMKHQILRHKQLLEDDHLVLGSCSPGDTIHCSLVKTLTLADCHEVKTAAGQKPSTRKRTLQEISLI